MDSTHNFTSRRSKKLGRYQIEKQVGAGGMGKVYKACDTSLERPVALKFLSREAAANPSLVQRFIREAKSTAKLRHPNIVTLYNMEEAQGHFFLVMDFIDGIALDRLLKKQKLSVRHSCKLLLPILAAIGYAHQEGILHRDIKPSNILISKTGKPFVTDFGLAKIVCQQTQALSQTNTVLGTPSYMAPEQANPTAERPVDHVSDIYSLGATFYQMLTGKPPIEGETVFNIMYKLANEEIQPPGMLNPNVTEEIELVCMTALAKDKALRYQNTTEMMGDIRHFLKNSRRQTTRRRENPSSDFSCDIMATEETLVATETVNKQVLPLAPYSFGQLLTTPVKLLWNCWRPLALIALVGFVAMAALHLIIPTPTWSLLVFLAMPLIYAAWSLSIIACHLETPLTIYQTLRHILTRLATLWGLLGFYTVLYLPLRVLLNLMSKTPNPRAVQLLEVCCFLVGIVTLAMLMKFVVAIPAAVIEKISPYKALTRSWYLTSGYKMRIVGMCLPFGVLCALVVGFWAKITHNSPILQAIGILLAFTLWLCLFLKVLYVDLRVRKEPLDRKILEQTIS